MDWRTCSQRRRREDRAVCPSTWPEDAERYERAKRQHSGVHLAMALVLASAVLLCQFLSATAGKSLENRERLLVEITEQRVKIPKKPKPPPQAVKEEEPEPEEPASEEPVEEEPMEVAETFGVDESAVVNGGGGIAVPVGTSLMTEPLYGLGDVARPPKIIRMVSPRYTEEARAAGVEGLVKLEVIVDSRGRVREVRVVRKIGYGLDESAMAALRQAKFKPAIYKGNPVACRLIIPIRFVLE